MIVRVDGVHVVPVGSAVNVGVCVSLVPGLVVVLEGDRTRHQADARARTEQDQCEAEMQPKLFSEAHRTNARRQNILQIELTRGILDACAADSRSGRVCRFRAL